MFGNVTALEGLHVIREIQELKHDARMLQAWRLVFSETRSALHGVVGRGFGCRVHHPLRLRESEANSILGFWRREHASQQFGHLPPRISGDEHAP